MTIQRLKERMLSNDLDERRRAAEEASALSPRELRSLFAGYKLAVDGRAVHEGAVHEFRGGEWTDAMLSVFLRREGPDAEALRAQVKQLYVRFGSKVSALAGFESLPAVERLILIQAPGLTHLDQLTWWKRLVDLQIQLPVMSKIRRISGLAKLPALRRLHLTGCEDVEDLGPIGTLTRLEELCVRWVTPRTTQPAVLKRLRALRHLELVGWPGLTDLRALASCTKLESLTLNDMPDLVSLAGLERLKKLTKLDIRGAGALKDTGAISKLKALDDVTLPDAVAR